MSRYRVSADIGGTFTDLVFCDVSTGEYKEAKVLSTPENLSDGIMNGISKVVKDFADIDFFVHGTTAGLNAVLERKGVKVALITTKGFKDVYEIARGNRKEMYNLSFKKIEPLITRNDVFEVEERILSDSLVETKLSESNVLDVIKEIKEKGYESIAVCLINAYLNPIHEVEIERIIEKKLPNIAVSLSHKIAREWREYERTSTTIMNAYIAPIVKNYLDFLEGRMSNTGFNESVYIMQSGGGVITSSVAKETPIQTLLSGPVGGAVGNMCISKTLNSKNLIGVDMGGTSYDVSLIIDGKPDVATETSLEGLPILTPMINIYTIAAAGGSIAWIEGGGLRVGPISAGANPGPACYGNGGKEPTITDANLVLGRIDPQGFLGGEKLLDKEEAIKAIKKVSDKLGLGVEETAEGICKIADAKMADAIKQITIRKGIDPRGFVLVSFGGAGSMHACLTADLLGIETILIPKMPGVFSAWGMLQSDIRLDTVRTVKSSLKNVSPTYIEEKYKEMVIEIASLLEKQNITDDQSEYHIIADMRYVGQEYTIRVPFENNIISESSLIKLSQDFHEFYHKIYGHSNQDGEVEMINLRLVGMGKLQKVQDQRTVDMSIANPTIKKEFKTIFDGKKYDSKIYSREYLKPGQKLIGPAIIEELSTTTVVPPNYEVTVDEYKNLVIKKWKRRQN